MGQSRYSRFALWLNYLNRETRVATMFLFVPFGGVMLLPFVWFLIEQWPFSVDGTTVQGKVVMKHQAGRAVDVPFLASMSLFAHGGRAGPKYFLQYEYVDAAGVHHSSQSRVSFETWRDAVAGAPITVHYVSSNPTKSQLEGEAGAVMQVLPFALIGTIMIVLSLWHGGRAISWVSRQVQLICEGDPVRGKILSARVEQLGKRRTSVYTHMEYEYSTPDVIRGSAQIPRAMRDTWTTGSAILILIDRDDPTNHALDIFDARREDRERLLGFPKS